MFHHRDTRHRGTEVLRNGAILARADLSAMEPIIARIVVPQTTTRQRRELWSDRACPPKCHRPKYPHPIPASGWLAQARSVPNAVAARSPRSSRISVSTNFAPRARTDAPPRHRSPSTRPGSQPPSRSAASSHSEFASCPAMSPLVAAWCAISRLAAIAALRSGLDWSSRS